MSTSAHPRLFVRLHSHTIPTFVPERVAKSLSGEFRNCRACFSNVSLGHYDVASGLCISCAEALGVRETGED